MDLNEIEESLKQTELEIAEEMKKSYKLSEKADKLTIITSILVIISFLIIIATTIINGIENSNSRRIDDMSSRIEQIEKDNVYRDEVINQTRSELNF